MAVFATLTIVSTGYSVIFPAMMVILPDIIKCTPLEICFLPKQMKNPSILSHYGTLGISLVSTAFWSMG